jgi:hypothetical protein
MGTKTNQHENNYLIYGPITNLVVGGRMVLIIRILLKLNPQRKP